MQYEYDANGNMISKVDSSNPADTSYYTYDIENRLIQISNPESQISNYYYDPFGRRLWKEVDGTTTYFMYADEGLVAELDDTGTETKTYGYVPNSTWTTDPLFMKEGSNYYFYHNDHLGTPQKMTSVNGAVVWSAKYSSFGEADVDAESTVTNNLRFPGQYYDEETGLHYNYQRYYDPRTGRYINADLIGLSSGDINIYRYAFNNPEYWIDYNGLFDDGKRNGKNTYLGHSDFPGWSTYGFDYTLEDQSWTSPYWPWSTWRHFRSMESVMKDLEKAIAKCDRIKFSIYMHQGQDVFSHYDNGFRMYPRLFVGPVYSGLPWGGHALAGKIPDQGTEAWLKAKGWTNLMLKKWHAKCAKCFSTEEYQIEQMNREAEEYKKFHNEIEHMLEKYRR